mgnify:CR=1 FL=1
MNDNKKFNQLDIELLIDYLESLGQPVVNEMINLYKKQVVIYIEEIENSLEGGSVHSWKDCCHKMKGAAGSLGLISLHSRLKLMENTTENINSKRHQLNDLKSHNDLAISELNDWFASCS